MEYFICFCLSGLFFSIPKYKKSKSIIKVSYFIAIMLPVVLSAVRGLDVGKDVMTYVYPAFLYAKNVRHFRNMLGYRGIEPGFLLLEYLGAKYLNSFSFVLGTIQLIVNYCFFKVIREKNGEKDLAVTMLIFYFFIYGSTLNAMRQAISVGLSMLSTYHFSEKKYKIAIILLVISVTFHRSSIITLVFWLIYFFAANEIVYRTINILIIFISFLLNYLWKPIISYIVNNFTLWKIYTWYDSNMIAGERHETTIICGLLALIILIIVNRSYSGYTYEFLDGKEIRWHRLLISMSLLFLFYQPLAEKIYVARRILSYPMAFITLVYPEAKRVVVLRYRDRDVSWLTDGIILLFFGVLWFYAVIITNADSIMPYTFRDFW